MGGSWLASAVLWISAPVHEAHATIEGRIHGMLTYYRELSAAADDNKQLRHQLEVLRSHIVRLHEFERENERLRALLNMADSTVVDGPVARVIGVSAAGWAHVVTIDKGRSDGVAIGNPVVAADGVVGRVIAVTGGSSQVLPIIDPKSSVDALVQSSRARGVFEGVGLAGGTLRFVEGGESVSVGDTIVTSGFDGVFPAGLALGRVASVERAPHNLFHQLKVEPSVNLSRLEQVMVVTHVPISATQGPENEAVSGHDAPEQEGTTMKKQK